jgi:hypothetical protein
MKNTPGPWELNPILNGHFEFEIYCKDNNPVCGVYCHSSILAGYGSVKDRISRSPEGQPEAIANARLIAAAPDLLEALKDIEKGCSFPEDDVQRTIRDRARIAIAKAEGKDET